MNMRTLFVIGDSVSIHYGPYLKKMTSGKYFYNRKGYVNGNAVDNDKTVDTNGGDSRMVLKYLSGEFNKRASYDVLLLNCGLHDIRVSRETNKIQVGKTEYCENLDKIFLFALKMSRKVVWVTTTPIIDSIHNRRKEGFLRYNKDVVLYNSIADMAVNKYGISSIDLYTFTRNLGEDIYRDHVHFKDEVSAMQGAFISGYLFGI